MNLIVGLAYQLEPDGTLRKLWSLEEWLYGNTYLSSDGRYLVQLEESPGGFEPSPRSKALSFFEKGKLLAATVLRSSSRYSRLAYKVHMITGGEKEVPEPRPELDSENKFPAHNV